ncbi:hypothetical protein [Hymenobacter cellulosilyticus]|uniref:SusD-like N-terminal domain-containing protein n=1 Tax=Hymenobacter cellulosilyticus TaxID=2932248 RepID=A0A8T9QCZ1_9BACT|nr:hypothetical protein [Hymenobacter cellulosilyticus]UOQ73988.1 hypothetical protein MUN79_08880 [Hymenobacter cellulosilyticus]
MLQKPTTQRLPKRALILALGTLSLLSGCGKDFLELQPRNAVTTEIFYKTQNDAIQATNAVYSQLQQNGMYNYSLWGIGDVMSDNSYLGGVGPPTASSFSSSTTLPFRPPTRS